MRLTAILISAAICLGAALPAQAEMQSYTLELGSRQVGTLQFVTGTTPKLTAYLDNTPLGVANGLFTATTQPVKTAQGVTATQYLSQSDKRNIGVAFADGQVLDTQIAPESEATPLSDPASVPVGVIPLTEGFARLATATGCPAPFAMYDGRRVVQIATVEQAVDGGAQTCTMDYRVTAGPGHLSPFRFKSLGMSLVYTDQQLAVIAVSAGGFEVRIIRR